MSDYHTRPTEITFKYWYKKGHVETQQKKLILGGGELGNQMATREGEK